MWPFVEETKKADEELEAQINTFFLYNELSRSYQFETMNKLVDKAVNLLSLGL